jgi:LPXTG-motif cell wall-anchored protein
LFTRLSRPAAAGLGSIVLACGVAAGVMAASTAHADVLGTMDVSPATGTDTSGVTLTTSGPCPSDATNLIVSVTGSGFPAAGQNVVSNSPISTYASTPAGGIAVPLTQTMRDYANTAGFSTLKGRYDFTLTCRAAFGSTTFGDFSSSMWFTSNTTYQNTDPSLPTGTPTNTTGTPTGTPTDTTSPTGTPTDTTSPTGTPTDTTSPTGTPTDTTSPTGTPTDTTSPTDSPTDTATPTDSATTSPTDTASTGGSTSGGSTDGGSSQGVSTTVGGSGSLAHTGTDAAVIGSAAALLLLVGGGAVWQTRRRREQAAELTAND